MKETILKKLLSADGAWVSGQDICQQLGVTRAAIWKHITSLRTEGWNIEAVSHRGYRIVERIDKVLFVNLTPWLTTTELGRTMTHLDEVDSTNTYGRKMTRDDAPHGTLIVAEHQTGGRGRSGRQWHSAPGEALQFSLLIRPPLSPARAALITQIAAAAGAVALEKLGVDCLIKWPNDLLIDGRKICGILTEMSCELDRIDWIIMGVGINVNQQSFPDDLKQKTTSLHIITNKPQNRAKLLASFLNAFEPLYQDYLAHPDGPQCLEICRSKSALTGKVIAYEQAGRLIEATVLDIDTEGRLLVRHHDGSKEALLSGEVHLIPPHKPR